MLQYRPPRIAMSLLLGAVVLQLIVSSDVPLLPASLAGGTLSALLGFGIMLRAWWLFRLRNTAICPTATTTTLITDDVFRLTRNPMYLGIALMLLGVAMLTTWAFLSLRAAWGTEGAALACGLGGVVIAGGGLWLLWTKNGKARQSR